MQTIAMLFLLRRAPAYGSPDSSNPPPWGYLLLSIHILIPARSSWHGYARFAPSPFVAITLSKTTPFIPLHEHKPRCFLSFLPQAIFDPAHSVKGEGDDGENLGCATGQSAREYELPKADRLRLNKENLFRKNKEKTMSQKPHYTTTKERMTNIVEMLIEKMEQGTGTWIKPWRDGMPRNFITQKPYRGFNILSLWEAAETGGFESNEWLTFNQIKGLGCTLKSGSKGANIFFFKMLEVKEENEEETTTKTIPLWKHYTVFNADQVEGLNIVSNINETIEPIESFIEATGATIHDNFDKAFYHTKEDFIGMPNLSMFNSENDYYATLLHELTHWTGHTSRLNREKHQTWGDDVYAYEELIAELGSAFLCSHFAIDITKNQHPEYLQNWIEAMKKTPSILWSAATKAQEAFDFLVGGVS